eukprot:TRINITY_DN3620_c0_g1_i1.p1 TRINITY_DN3620_c0_g1~~TRINITY_DN3620_c0_g1_i1.p1  ORF type:complete len:332 (-),score=93.79 TRINITY_DN3620_c0_g1_i1:56-1051(-)
MSVTRSNSVTGTNMPQSSPSAPRSLMASTGGSRPAQPPPANRPNPATLAEVPNVSRAPPPPTNRPNPSVGNEKPVESIKDMIKRQKEEEKQKKKQEKEYKKASKKGSVKALNIEGPTNVTHVAHVGFGSDGFDIRNIPPEWRAIMKSAGVKRSDLQNSETVSVILSTISQSLASSVPPTPAQSPSPAAPRSPPSNAVPQRQYNAPLPPPPSRQVSQFPVASNDRGSLPPPETSPPPAPLSRAPQAPPPPLPPREETLPPPPPPVPNTPTENSLMAQLVKAQLKSVEKGSLPPIETFQEKNLVSTLEFALRLRRKDIHEDEEAQPEEDEDDW